MTSLDDELSWVGASWKRSLELVEQDLALYGGPKVADNTDEDNTDEDNTDEDNTDEANNFRDISPSGVHSGNGQPNMEAESRNTNTPDLTPVGRKFLDSDVNR